MIRIGIGTTKIPAFADAPVPFVDEETLCKRILIFFLGLDRVFNVP